MKDFISENTEVSLKSFMCDYLRMVKDRSDITYSDIKHDCKVTDKQLSAIFNRQGNGVTIEVVERVYKALGIMFAIQICERGF